MVHTPGGFMPCRPHKKAAKIWPKCWSDRAKNEISLSSIAVALPLTQSACDAGAKIKTWTCAVRATNKKKCEIRCLWNREGSSRRIWNMDTGTLQYVTTNMPGLFMNSGMCTCFTRARVSRVYVCCVLLCAFVCCRVHVCCVYVSPLLCMLLCVCIPSSVGQGFWGVAIYGLETEDVQGLCSHCSKSTFPFLVQCTEFWKRWISVETLISPKEKQTPASPHVRGAIHWGFV